MCDNKIISNLTNQRLELKITIDEISKKTTIPSSVLSKFENGNLLFTCEDDEHLFYLIRDAYELSFKERELLYDQIDFNLRNNFIDWYKYE